MKTTDWGPHNPHPLSRMKTELVWEGKYDEYGNRRPVRLPSYPLPLQRVETIDAPCDAAKARAIRQGDLFDQRAFTQSSHRDDFRNMLIWGDNKLALAALLEQFRGKVDLIYIDPPYAVGADFKVKPRLGDGDDELTKEHSVLEEVAYRDLWGKQVDSYLQIMYERLSLAETLLKPGGLMYVHADRRMIHFIRSLCDEILGGDNLRNEIIWCYRGGGTPDSDFAEKHDTILRYSKGTPYYFDVESVRIPYSEASSERLKHQANVFRGDRVYRGYRPNEGGKHPEDWWTIQPIMPSEKMERSDYPTQKPLELLQRIIDSSCPADGLVLDFFCGSGTTLACSEGLRVGRDPTKSAGQDKFLYFAPPRKWIGVDLGRYAVHTSRKRLIGVQRELHTSSLPYRSFDVYNLGRYERQWWQLDRLHGADTEHRRIVLKFYKAAPLDNSPSPLLHGMKNGAYVHVDKIDSIFVFDEARTVAQAAQAVGARELQILAWEFEMELKRKLEALEAETGVKLRTFQIPREIMEPNRNEVQFFEAGALEAEIVRHDDGSLDVRLKQFIPALAEAPEAELEMLRERAVKSPFDFIDFWAIDFDWDGIEPFEHHWQDYRTRKDRSLKTTSNAKWQYDAGGQHRICVKVIDVFGVDTTTVLEVQD